MQQVRQTWRSHQLGRPRTSQQLALGAITLSLLTSFAVSYISSSCIVYGHYMNALGMLWFIRRSAPPMAVM